MTLTLLLVDANCDVQGFYECENDYGIDEAVETILQLNADRVVDFREAQQEYFAEYSLVDLYEAVKNNAQCNYRISYKSWEKV